jgi:protein-disulfide isomerase
VTAIAYSNVSSPDRSSRSRLRLPGMKCPVRNHELRSQLGQFSKKMFNTVYDSVFPLVKSKYAENVQFIFRQQIQPWHPSSTLVHEAGVAVLQTNPDKFWEFSKALFDKQDEYFDVNVVNETRNHTYSRLSKLAGGVGIDEKKIYSLLEISDKPGEDGSLNSGNKVTNDIKLMTKANRLTGVHVTPTVLFNVIMTNIRSAISMILTSS